MAYSPEQRKAYDKAYRAANKERRATNDKAYCATEHGTQRRAAAFKAWYGANRDRKAAALKALYPDDHSDADFVVKLNGYEILDESVPISQTGAIDGSTLLVTFRRRRPVRS